MKIKKVVSLVLLSFALSCGKEESRVEGPDLPLAKTIALRGNVIVKTKDREKPLSIGDVIKPHDRIVTGPGSTVDILIKGQGVVSIPEKEDLELITLVGNLTAQADESISFLNRLNETKNSVVHKNHASGGIWFIFRLLFLLPLIWIARGVVRYFHGKGNR